VLQICFINVKKNRKSLRKLSGIFTETFRKFSSLFIPHSVSHMRRTPMGCLGLTFSYMQCSNMHHKCEEIQKKVYGNFPKIFRKFSENFRKLSGIFPETFRKFSSLQVHEARCQMLVVASHVLIRLVCPCLHQAFDRLHKTNFEENASECNRPRYS
jgi:hypothetical protein